MKRLINIGIVLMLAAAVAACAPKIETTLEDEPEKKGDFYSLQEAYDLELLTQDDLKNIAYYLSVDGGVEDENEDDSFVPLPKTPEVLSIETENAIKETRAYYLRNLSPHSIQDAKADGIRIFLYFGTYNNCVAVMMYDYFAYTAAGKDVTIAEVVFHYWDGNTILIWKKLISV